jgi:hypothetical protein
MSDETTCLDGLVGRTHPVSGGSWRPSGTQSDLARLEDRHLQAVVRKWRRNLARLRSTAIAVASSTD